MLRKSAGILSLMIGIALLGGCAQNQGGTNQGGIIQGGINQAGMTQAAAGTVNESQGEYPYTFTDSAGENVTLTARPERVAVLFSSYADVWKAAGGEIYVTVGESVERGFAPEDVLLVDQGAGKTIDNELLVSYEPDFVICSADIAAQNETAELLKEAGIPCASFRVECLDEYLYMLKICTDITGDGEAFRRSGTEVKERSDRILNQTAKQEEKRKILFIRSGSGESSAKAKTAELHFAAAMLEELGTCNIADNAPVLLDGLSLEEILKEDPDYIFISTMGKEEAARAYMDSVLADSAWQALSAVQEGRVNYLPKDLFQFKPNARWDEAYEYLAEILYPELDVNEK